MEPSTIQSITIVVCILSFCSSVFQILSVIPWDGDERQFGVAINSIGARCAYSLVAIVSSVVSLTVSISVRKTTIEVFDEDFAV